MADAETITTKRRSRMRRMPTGKRIELTLRDFDILRLLNRYRFLRSTFIHAFVGGNKTKLVERLGQLYHEAGHLDRPAQQWQAVNARYQPAVYELSEKGAEVLGENGGSSDGGGLGCRGSGPYRQFAHMLMVCEILASFELAAAQTAGLRLVWWPEILAKAPAETQRAERPLQIGASNGPHGEAGRGAIEPDAVFGIEYRTGKKRAYRFFALEADRGTMPVERTDKGQSSYLAKLIAYRAIIADGTFRRRWGVPNLFVFTVTTSESRLDAMQAAVRKITDGRGSGAFLFKVYPGAVIAGHSDPAPQLLIEPWTRAGREPLDIAAP